MHPAVRTLALSALLLATTAANLRANVSWGKVGIEYDQYRRDSMTCGMAGATRDMSGQEAYKEAVHGIKLQDSALDGEGDTGDALRDYALIQRRTMQRQVPELQHYLVSGVERCLIGKGYTPFTLTKDQAHALGKFHHGTEQRFRYLHGLASDPAVLDAQKIEMEEVSVPRGAR